MKKQMAMILSAAMALGSLGVMPAQAEDTLIYGGLEYEILNDQCVMLTGCSDKTVTSVDIPAKIDGRDVIQYDSVFTDCPNLTEINVDDDSLYLCDIEGVLFDSENNVLLDYPRGLSGEYAVPESTKMIGMNSFADAKKLTYIEMPDSAVCIDSQAFRNCSSLTGFSKPIKLLNAGDALFGCTSLKSVEFAESADGTTVAGLNFTDCPELESVIIPENYVLTGKLTFRNCPKIEEIVIPKSDSTLSAVINNCESLKSFVINENDISIDRSSVSVSDCPAITELDLSGFFRTSIKNLPSLETLKMTSVYYDEKSSRIDFETCPELKDVYSYANSVNCEEAKLMAEYGVKLHCRNRQYTSEFLEYYNVDYVFLEDELLYGDANMDGTVNMADAVYIMQSVSNPDNYKLSELGALSADVCGNDGITAADALAIQKYTLGLIDNLPV